MEKDKRPPESAQGRDSGSDDHHDNDTPQNAGVSRRELLGSAAVGAALGALATAGLSPETLLAAPQGNGPPGGLPPGQAKKGVVLKGGVVLTLDPDGSDYAKADVRIEGSKIVAIGPNLGGDGAVIDCTGMIVMPGFINTHHHQYYTLLRASLADGLFPGGAWPQEGYNSVAGNVWTTGRIGSAANPTWDLGRPPMDPEDLYISELVASVNDINNGVTTGIDTSQASHTPAHTDAMIQGLMDSGRRGVYAYSGGTNRSAQFPDQPFEFPGAIGNETSGIGRLRNQWFSSDDQLVTLGHTQNGALARFYGAQIVVHTNGTSPGNASNLGPEVTCIHCINFTPASWDTMAATGAHVSIAGPIEMQMGHGTPPYQHALDRGILPSFSTDVDTNMTSDMFTQMRMAFCLQRLFVHNNQTTVYPPHTGKPDITCRQILRMATLAGAAGAGLSDKVGMLKVGMEADIIVLQARALNSAPMVNGTGTVVTMMDTSNVDTVIIGGAIKKRAGKLVGVDVEKLIKDVELAQERVLARIQGPALVGAIPDGNHSAPGYTPSMVGSCCFADAYADTKP